MKLLRGNKIAKTAILTSLASQPTGIFAVGAPCEGAVFALGRNFFTKYSLKLGVVDYDNTKFTVGFAPAQSQGFGWIILISLIGIAVIIIVIIVVFLLRKNKGENIGENFSRSIDE